MEQSRYRASRLALAHGGWRFLLPPLAVGLLALAWGLQLLGWGAMGVAAFAGLFFRDPDRAVPQTARCVVSPADGRVVAIRQAEGSPERGGAVQTVSIFLSLWDVHVNRAPCEGTVQRMEYTPGKFLPAFRGDASRANERNTIWLDARGTPIVVSQIAGAVARRIVCWVRPGEALERGQRIGMIRFGSRVDVTLPASATLLVDEGRKVKGGTTVLARLAPEEASREP